MFKKSAKAIYKSIFNFFFPPRCIFCKKPLTEEGICEECRKEIPYVKSKIINPQFVIKTCAPLCYEGRVRASIIRYKFHGKTAYVEHYAKLMHEMIKNRIDGNIDYITWVPLSAKKLKKRGYDQAELVARALSKIMNVPTVCSLKKIRENLSQHKLKTVPERRANVVGAYSCINYDKLKGKNLLIIDDVLTTGSTISECARTLKVAGAGDLFVATIAKTQRNSKKRLKKL